MKKFLLLVLVTVLLSITITPIRAEGGGTNDFVIYTTDGSSYNQTSDLTSIGVSYVPASGDDIATLTFNSSLDMKRMDINTDMNIIVNADINFKKASSQAILANGDYKIYLKIADGVKIKAKNNNGSPCNMYKGVNPLYSLELKESGFKDTYGFDGKYRTNLEHKIESGNYVLGDFNTNECTLMPEGGVANLSLIPIISDNGGKVTKLKAKAGGGYEEDGIYDTVNGFITVTDATKSVSYDNNIYTVEVGKSPSYLYLEFLFPESEYGKTINYSILDPTDPSIELATLPTYYETYSDLPDKITGSAYDAGDGDFYISYFMTLTSSDEKADGTYVYHDISLKFDDGTNVKYINVNFEKEPTQPVVPINNGPVQDDNDDNDAVEVVSYRSPNTSVK